MIPVPDYLREIAVVEHQKDETLTMRVVCPCGGRLFTVYKNVPKKASISKENAQKLKETKKWYREHAYGLPDLISVEETVDTIVVTRRGSADGSTSKGRHKEVYRLKPGEVPLSFAEQIELSPTDYTVVLKAQCSACGSTHLLFDSRVHGNDAADFTPEVLEEYAFRQKKLGGSLEAAALSVTVKNDWDFDDIAGNGNPGLTENDYARMFGYIKVQAVTQAGKSVTVYAEDLG